MKNQIYNYGLRLLGRQDYSEFKLKRKLLGKFGTESAVIEEVISELKSRGYLNEDNYKRLFIRKWLMKGESYQKIAWRAQAEQMTITSQEVDNNRQDLSMGTDSVIEKLIEKKLRNVEIPQGTEEFKSLKSKLFRYLLSKGHDYSSINSALAKYLKN